MHRHTPCAVLILFARLLPHSIKNELCYIQYVVCTRNFSSISRSFSMSSVFLSVPFARLFIVSSRSSLSLSLKFRKFLSKLAELLCDSGNLKCRIMSSFRMKPHCLHYPFPCARTCTVMCVVRSHTVNHCRLFSHSFDNLKLSTHQMAGAKNG